MLQVAAGPLLQRTISAPDLWNHATGLHLQRMSSAWVCCSMTITASYWWKRD